MRLPSGSLRSSGRLQPSPPDFLTPLIFRGQRQVTLPRFYESVVKLPDFVPLAIFRFFNNTKFSFVCLYKEEMALTFSS